MIDLLFPIAFSNVCIALTLAAVAMVVESTLKRPHLAHMLWLLVFLKLVTPPIVTIPVIAIPGLTDTTSAIIQDPLQHNNDGQGAGAAAQINGINNDVAGSSEVKAVILEQFKVALLLIWMLGSGFIFVWSLVRVSRFKRLLRLGSDVAPQTLQIQASGIAHLLKLKAVPTIYTTSAHISPMVWWIGGKVRIVIPLTLLDKMDTQQFKWILAHELAHVRRRDYLVRWIEWLACVCFWWNPLVWWGRHHLRANEELCCDALVVSSLNPRPHTYADSLLSAVECLACPMLRPPAVASEINSGGFLERRVKIIISKNPIRNTSRLLKTCVLVCALAVLPLSVAYGQQSQSKTDAYLKSAMTKIQKAIEAGKLTDEQAKVKLDEIKKAISTPDKREVYFEAMVKRIITALKSGQLTEEEWRDIDDEASFDDRWVKAGDTLDDTLGDAKGLEIGPMAATLQWEGKRMMRSPVLVAANTEKSSSRNRSSNSNKQRNNSAASANSPAQLLEDVKAGKLSREDALKKVYDVVTNDVKSGKIPQEAADEIVGDFRGDLYSDKQ